MQYKLIIVEGSTDTAFLNVLLDKDLLIYRRDELLLEEPRHCRQIGGDPMIIDGIKQIGPNDMVKILRVGDTLTDKLKIPPIIKWKIDLPYDDYHILPELEITIIISEGLYGSYEKRKSTTSPKAFAKANIKFNKKRYDCSPKWIYDYWERKNPIEIYDALNIYDKKKARAKIGEQTIFKLVRKPANTSPSSII